MHNTGATSHTWTLSSTADRFGRTKDISAETIAAGAIRIFGPLELEGWVQTDGRVYVSANSTEVEFGVTTLPG
ncbi:MAG: hypothetical protein M1546_05485 [Chloroflexi bacterium]|nr:hypothetical protein [Chloroflexota bacterium]